MSTPASIDQRTADLARELNRVQDDHGPKAVIRYVLSGYHPEQPEYQFFMEALAAGDFFQIARAILLAPPVYPMTIADEERSAHEIDPAEFGLPPIFLLFSGDRAASQLCIGAVMHFMLTVPASRALLLTGDAPGVQVKAYLAARKLNFRNTVFEPEDKERWGVLAAVERDKALLSIAAGEAAERLANDLPCPITRHVVFTETPDALPGHVRALARRADELGIQTLVNPREWEEPNE